MASAASMQEALRRHGELVQECKRLQNDTLQKTLFDVMHVDMGKSDFRTKSTVGIMLNDCVVDNLVVGGPAFNSRQIQQGDSILKIDGKAVSPENILTHLVGPDVPGSTVKLTVSKKGGATKEIALKRMDTVIIGGKLKLFDLFTRTKERALDSKDESLPGMVDECIQAWTDMTIADGEREAKQIEQFHCMQEACGKSLTELETRLEELKAVAVKMQGFDADLRKEVERLKAALDTSNAKCRDLEGELKRAQEKVAELTATLDKSEREKSALAKEMESMQAEWDKTLGELAVKTRELSDASHEIAELKRKIERDSEAIARLEKEVQRVNAELEQEKVVRKKTERDLADERGRATMLEMSWNKTVVQRDGLQEQLEKMQAEWDKAQAALAAKNRMYADLEDRLATSQRKVEALDHENKNLQASIDDLEKKLFQEQESRIQAVRKLEAEIEVLSRERDLLQRERANCLVRLEELSEQHGKLKSTNSELKTENEGNAVRIKELELQLKDALHIKVQLQAQVDTLNPEKFELQQRLRSTEMDLQARKDELARTVAENVKLLGSLDAEKASHLERREMLLRATEDREKAVAEKSKVTTECGTLQVELRHCRGNLESMEQRLAQANVELRKAQDALAAKVESSDQLEARERQLEEVLAKTNQEVERLREAIERAEAKTLEASKNEDQMRAKYNDVQLKLHEANGRAEGLQHDLEDSKNSLETEIKNGADKEAALMKEQAYCRSLEKELAGFKIKYQNQETQLISARESDRHHSMTMADLEVSLNTTRSTMSAEQSKLQQDLVLARLAVEQIFKAVDQKNAEVDAEKKKLEGSNDKEREAGAGKNKDGAENPPADGSTSEAPGTRKVATNGNVEEESLSSRPISDMATITCKHVHELGKKVIRLQQQNTNLLNQVGQVEEVRLRADTLGRDKYLAEEELTKVRATMDQQKTDLETVRKTKARLETELQAADAKVSMLNKTLLDMESQHAKDQLAAANQRTQLESLISQLKATLSDTEARVTDLTFTVQDDVQARAFLAESIACIARIHRTVTKDDEAGSNAGIGISVRMEKDFCVVKALDESAAGKDSRAMLPHTIQVGHVIESVDGQAVRGLGKNAVQDMLVGPVGTDVSVGARGTGEGDVPYIVTLKRFAKEDSLRSVSERTVDVCARTSRFLHDIESLKAELSAMSVDLQRKEEMLTESVRAREASNKQLLGLEEREKFFQSEKDGLQAQIDVLNMQLASSKEQVVELDGRNEKNTEIISFSQKKIFDLENTISELDKDKQRLSDVVAKLEQQTKNMKAELLSSQARYATELQNMEGEVEKLHAQLLKQGRTAALLMDAEKREMILKRSLETYEQERNTYKRESALLGSDLKTARSSLEERANDLTATQQDLNSTRQRISEVEAMCKELQDAAAAATKSRQECASQLQDARLKTRLLLDAMKGAVSQWQGVGMVVRSGGPGKPITIKDLRPGGSAWRSGVLNDGDFLVAVDGKNVSGMEVREIQALILGPEGTTVNVVARSSRGGRNFSVDLVRGDGAKAEQSWDDEVKDAIDAATAMHAEGQSIREVVRGLVQETKRRDADVEMTLRTVENSFEDARLSWQDVSSSLLSFTARQTPRKTSDAVEADSLARDVGEIQFNSNVVVAVQTNTIKSKASLARISELALESLRQISDGVKIRQDLQRQLASLDKTRGDQQLLEEEMARMRADCEARMRGLKSDNASLAARLAEAEREVQAAKAKASDAVLAAEDAKSESTSLRKQKDALLLEMSDAVEAQRALHAAIRQQQASQDGVGMVLRLSGDKCVVKAITPGGPASHCPQLHVGDALLAVNGHNVQGKSVVQVTELFLGPTGSTVTIRAVRDIEDSFEVQLVRGKTEEGIKNAKAIVEEDVNIVHKMHADAAKFNELKAEYADLEWALKQQQDENRIFTQQLNTFKKEVEKMEDELAAALKRAAEAEKQVANLRQQLDVVSAKLADKNKSRQGEIDEIEALLKVAERERDMALQARDFMEERQRQCETEAIKLQKDLNSKSEELDRAWEELAVAQATIQALQKRVTELSEDSASPAAASDAGAAAEAAELRGRLRQAQDQLATSSTNTKAMQAEIAGLKSKLQEVMGERDKLKAIDRSPSGAGTPRSTTSNPASTTRRATPTRSVASSGGKVGIGLVITDSAPHRITSVVPGGSAHACGLIREGDTLLTVDDTPVEDLDVAGVRGLLLGEPGSKVDLTLKRLAPQDNEFPEYKVRVIRGVQSSKPRFI